jgi:hypothetical protein
MLEYQNSFIKRVIIYCLAAYGIIGYAAVLSRELSNLFRLVKAYYRADYGLNLS